VFGVMLFRRRDGISNRFFERDLLRILEGFQKREHLSWFTN
jgi:hypothetical protein